MTERDLRKYHGMTGFILALFMFVQIGSGSLIAFNEFLGQGRHVHAEPAQHEDNGHGDVNHEDSLIQIIHHYGGRLIQALRVLLGLGALYMVISGTRIYVLARNRKKQLLDKP